MEEIVERNIGLHTDTDNSEDRAGFRLMYNDMENAVVLLFGNISENAVLHDNAVLHLARRKTDGTEVDEPPKRKRKKNRIEEDEETEEHVANVQEQSQEEGFFMLFSKTVKKLAHMCKNAPQNLPKGMTSKMGEMLGDSIETVTDFLMKIVKGSGKVPGWLSDIMKKTANTNLSEKLLNNLAGLIGQNWKSLGLDLGLSWVEIDHISEENTGTLMKIFSMLRKWMTSSQEDVTTSDLLLAMWNCEGLHVDWKRLANVLV